MTQLSLKQKIGQLFILGFSGDTITADDPIGQDIRKRNLGGVILFDRCLASSQKTNNIINARQLKLLTASLQQLSEVPFLVAVDQEGGRVSRFTQERGFPVTPAAIQLGNSPDLQATIASAQQTARMLRDIGVNLNLAPVVDLDVYRENPIIGKYGRSFSADPAIVTACARAWIREHRQLGILSCLKHFPGHGSSRTDSHLDFVDITETWQENELVPYQQLIRTDHIEAIMLGHLFHRVFDAQYPATLSRATIQTLVRQQLGFDGVIISDDMQMKAITGHYGLEEACCKALAAGVDLVIIGNNLDRDPLILSKVIDALLRQLDKGTISEARLEEAWGRIQNFKQPLMSHGNE
jgi:beta-N-acetylhexosaminidase